THLTALLRLSFFQDAATTQLYTLSLHDALPISRPPAGCSTGWTYNWIHSCHWGRAGPPPIRTGASSTRTLRSMAGRCTARPPPRSEEHTSELQSRENLVCRLLLEKKKTRTKQD